MHLISPVTNIVTSDEYCYFHPGRPWSLIKNISRYDFSEITFQRNPEKAIQGVIESVEFPGALHAIQQVCEMIKYHFVRVSYAL